MECIVHYPQLATFTEAELSENVINRIHLARDKRIRIGGRNHHPQCDKVPDAINNANHKVHLECYKSFTSILGNKKYKEEKEVTRRQSDRLQSPISSPTTLAWVYPKECNICSKYRVQFSGKKYEPYRITTYSAEATIKAAAKDKNDKLYQEIEHLDLIAKEFKVHKKCYQNFTSGYALSARSSEETNQPKESCYSEGKFEEVKKFVEDEIIGMGRAVSMYVIHKIYDLEINDSRYRNKLKKRLQNHFKELISFITPNTKSCEIVIPTTCIDADVINHNKMNTIQTAANYIREDIMNKLENLPGIKWPPTLEQLSSPERAPTESLCKFLETLIYLEGHRKSPSRNLVRLVDSFAQDITSAVSRGKQIQYKQFLLGQGLHNLTGSRKVIDILHKLGHCIPYNTVCEIETAEAECALEAAKLNNILMLKPTLPEQTVFTHFWVDNFDLKVDRIGGGGSINTTHLMGFQENQPHCQPNSNIINVPRRKSRLLFYEDLSMETKPVNVYKNPEKIESSNTSYNVEKKNYLKNLYTMWIYIRKQNDFNQIVPIFKGWLLRQRTEDSEILNKTMETYLPPITTKVTEFSTIQKYLTYLQGLAASVNMPYVNVTLDVGAAINAYKTIWSLPDQYHNIVIHLGSFHFLKENFQILGSLATGSGFEDVLYQSGLCTSGSLKGVIAASHYNRAWSLHSIFTEALERLLMSRFIIEKKPYIPAAMRDYCLGSVASPADEVLTKSRRFLEDYERYRNEVANGSIGKTAQYWMIYLNLMRMQSIGQQAIHQNDTELLICTWKMFIPFYFAMNKTNYARYGSYYVHMLMNMEKKYPGMTEFLNIGGISAQSQTKHAIRTATDQRGEQTINKDAKTTGGIKAFASNNVSVLKWCLNRPYQAKNTKGLKDYAGIDSSTLCYKPLRLSEIERTERNVGKVIEVLQNEYLNPFNPGLDVDKLYNLSSGVPKEDGVEELLTIEESGNAAAREFMEKRLLTTEVDFHDPITRVKIPSFQETYVKISKKGSEKVVRANRDIISHLLSLSTKCGKPIDFRHALKYPLHPVPLSMAFPDGSKRDSSKSKLLHEIIPDVPNKSLTELGVDKTKSAYVIDMIAQIRCCISPAPNTFEDLAKKLLQSLPKGYKRYDIVADTYRESSIKSAEREKRGTSSKVLIGSIKSRLPSDVNKFMLNNDNKTSLIKLIFNFIVDEKQSILRTLETEKIILSGDDECITITNDSTEENIDLKSNQEEADTKVILHAINVIRNGDDVVIRSPSGDTDIIVLGLALVDDLSKVYMDYGNGKNRKRMCLDTVGMKDEEKNALIGFHSFTGNDYVPSLFRKGKKRCWSVLKSNECFLRTFAELGTDWNVTEQQVNSIEEYVCALYSSKKESVDEVRYDLFEKKQNKEGKIVDLSLIPPCFSSLYLQIKRANFIGKLWKSTPVAQVVLPNIEDHGWNIDGSILWTTELYPEDTLDLLINAESDSDEDENDDYEESEVESESDDDDNE